MKISSTPIVTNTDLNRPDDNGLISSRLERVSSKESVLEQLPPIVLRDQSIRVTSDVEPDNLDAKQILQNSATLRHASQANIGHVVLILATEIAIGLFYAARFIVRLPGRLRGFWRQQTGAIYQLSKTQSQALQQLGVRLGDKTGMEFLSGGITRFSNSAQRFSGHLQLSGSQLTVRINRFTAGKGAGKRESAAALRDLLKPIRQLADEMDLQRVDFEVLKPSSRLHKTLKRHGFQADGDVFRRIIQTD